MVGARGFEPPTPWSRTLQAALHRVTRNEYKLHRCNRLIGICGGCPCKQLQRVCGTYTGLDSGVMSQSTAQFPVRDCRSAGLPASKQYSQVLTAGATEHLVYATAGEPLSGWGVYERPKSTPPALTLMIRIYWRVTGCTQKIASSVLNRDKRHVAESPTTGLC